MKRILITGAGGTPSTNFVRSLRASDERFHLIGVDGDKYYLQRAETDERYLVPLANEPDYISVLKSIIDETRAEMIYSQPDPEIIRISQHREELGVRSFLPDHRTIELCHDKFESFRVWKNAGIKVPETMMITTKEDLERAFEQYGAPIWIRAIVSPGGGKGALRVDSIRAAASWIDFHQGWGSFTAAQCLRPESVTWLSIWRRGELVVAQGRKRLYWELGNRAPSGVTGITGAGVTVDDPVVDEIALRVIRATDPAANGIFAVDLTYDQQGVPNPTEINIGRFFTTHEFFTRAGLNLPHLFVKLAYDEPLPLLPRKMNPLTPGLAWIRGVDFLPILTDLKQVASDEEELTTRRAKT